jgi:hypothetical protein
LGRGTPPCANSVSYLRARLGDSTAGQPISTVLSLVRWNCGFCIRAHAGL